MQGAAFHTDSIRRFPIQPERHVELKTNMRWPFSALDNSPAQRSGDTTGKPCDDERHGEKIVLSETTRLVNREEGMTSESAQTKSMDWKSKQE